MQDGFAQLGHLTGVEIDTRLKPVGRAWPHHAQAKPIEGIFAVLEQQVQVKQRVCSAPRDVTPVISQWQTPPNTWLPDRARTVR